MASTSAYGSGSDPSAHLHAIEANLLPTYPPGFRPRRGLNWGFLGLLYTSFYLCRYNISVANEAIRFQYHLSKVQMSWILTAFFLVYAFGQIFNGLLTDRIGGKRAMFIGAVGTVILNVAFGLVGAFGHAAAASALGVLGLFIGIRAIDGYFQSLGAPGMTKIKTAWFAKTERGGFAGIFGFMINLGRLGIFNFGPALLAGFTLFGMFHVNPLHWYWLFWGPSIICFIVACGMLIFVQETPEEAGYMPVEKYAGATTSMFALVRNTIVGIGLLLLACWVGYLWHVGVIGTMDLGALIVLAIIVILVIVYVLARIHRPDWELNKPSETEVAAATRQDISRTLVRIATNPAVWIVGVAYACTGAVRQPIDQWFPSYMYEVHGVKETSSAFQFLAFMLPLVASAGSLLSGYVSDKLFAGARAPVAGALYLIEACVVFTAAHFHSTTAAIVFFILISFTANSTHSILGTAAAMDIGGKKMTGFAAGLIDSFQYFGASVGIWILGYLLDSHWHWNAYFYYMVPFGLIGFLLMLFFGKTIAAGSNE